jgi:class 3 adenylate cyclase/predicted ATPase
MSAAKESQYSRLTSSGERRQLSILFCDLVGSTALSVQLDIEDLREVITAFHHCCDSVIRRSGGFVARYVGDGLLAYFGYPHAHEDDAERAVRAGLALIDGVARLNIGSAGTLQVRVGIATGLVVVGDLFGEQSAQAQEAFGITPNLAARLQALAAPQTLVIADSTRQLLGGLFEYRALGMVELKGFAEPMSAWEVTGISVVDSRFEALRRTTTPLLGRDEEIGMLRRRWEQAKRGEGCVVLVSGEAGIGKSRLAQTLFDQLSGEPHTRLRYFCSPYHQDSALYPVITQLERAAGFRREDTPAQRLDKLEALLAPPPEDHGEEMSLLVDLLSIQSSGRYPPRDLSPQKRKEMTLKALLAQVEKLARHHPLLMLSEDAHWGDPTSLEMLDMLVERLPGLPILLIITFRPDFTPPWIGRWQATLISLNRLAPRQRSQMIDHLTGGKALPKEIANQIITRSDGIPLFVEELTKSVLESGVLRDAGDRYEPAGTLAQPAIPTSLRDSLMARLDRLAPAREVAQLGAALGRQFSHELISAVATMPRQQLDDALQQLVSGGLIHRRGDPPDAEYTFKHALVQDAAYRTLLRKQRQQLHGHIAATLEVRFPDIVATQPAILAQHCAEAALTEKAILYWLRAGQRALARSAMTEAGAQLRKGLDLVSSLSTSVERQRLELDLHIAHGSALAATKGYAAEETGAAFARARQLCEQLNEPPQLVLVLNGQWVYHLIRAELSLARQRAEETRRLGEARNDLALKWLGCFASGLTCLNLGEFPAARTYLEQGIALFDPAHRPIGAQLGLKGNVGSLIHLSWALTFLGYLDQGRAKRDEALAEARQLSHAWTLALATSVALHFDWCVDAAHALLQRSERLGALSAEQDFPFCWAAATLHRGWCLVALGQKKEGLAFFDQGLTAYRATGSVLNVPFGLIKLADAYGKAGQPEEGLNRLAEAACAISETQERYAEAELHRVRGELLKSLGDYAAAVNSFCTALAVARGQSAKLLELRAAMSLARLWRDAGKRNDARDLLALVYDWFTEGLDTPVLQDAGKLLRELS